MWTCPKCRQQVESTFEVCWNCGTAMDGTEDPSFTRAEDETQPEPSRLAHAITEDPAFSRVEEEAITARPPRARQAQRERKIIITTTPSVEGQQIKRYCGLVTGEAIMGANIVKDFFASITDIVGGRSSAYEGELREAREIALAELEQAAFDLGANAVVGVDLDYETIGQGNSMLMVCASGTAVLTE